MAKLALPKPPDAPKREELQAVLAVLYWLSNFHRANTVEWYALMATRQIVSDAITLTYQ